MACAPGESEAWKAKNEKVNKNKCLNFRHAASDRLADEVADECRARELLSDEWDPQFNDDFPELKLDSIKGTFPNGRIHISNKPHSAKRILSPCLGAIKCINEVFHRMIRSRIPPSKIIHNSPAFQEQYSDQMLGEQTWRSKKLKDLGMSNMK